jgi:hypothetical protein
VKLNKADLRLIYTSLGRLIPPFGRAPDAAEVVAIGQLRDVVADAIRDFAPVLERGELVFSWRVPREQALTMNAYAHKKGWMKKKMRQELDKVRRWVRVTRFSTQRVDDLSVDILGGKMPVDALVRCGVLSDDNDAMAFREPRWEKTERGNTHVLVEVFTIREETEGHENDDPPDTTIAQIVRKPGPFTAWLAAGPPVKKPPPEDIF